jgi:hypothetical protein
VKATGLVISIHQLGATVRLEDGSLAAVPESELTANRPAIVRSLRRREPLAFDVNRDAPRAIAYVSRGPSDERAGPRLLDATFERQIAAYLKSTEEWAPPDRPEPAERHFIRKKRRAAFFEARSKGS